MPDFAENIEITHSGLKINGEEVPWYIAQGGVSLVGGEGMETLTLTLLTGRVGTIASGDSGETRKPAAIGASAFRGRCRAALRDLQASPSQAASWAAAIADELEAEAGKATPDCLCDGVNLGCSRSRCPSRAEQ